MAMPNVSRPRPRVAFSTNAALKGRTPGAPGGAKSEGAGVVPPKMASGAQGARKAMLDPRAKAAGRMKGGYGR